MLSRYRSPTELAIEIPSHDRLGTYEEAFDLSCLLRKKAEADPSYLRFYHGSEEGFTLWQQALSPQYYETALEERFELAIELSLDHPPTGRFLPRLRKDHFYNGPALIRRALTRDYHIPRLAVGMRNGKDLTLLHAVALKIGELAQYLSIYYGETSKVEREHLAGRSD